MSSTIIKEIDAILGEEFEQLLESLGVREDFDSGKYVCFKCGETVNKGNVLLVFPLSETEVGFVCKKQDCSIEYRSALEAKD